MRRFEAFAVEGLPLIQAGDDLVELLLQALQRSDQALQNNDILVITSKIVSKSEGRKVALSSVTPSARAYEVAEITQKDSRVVELVLQESTEISRMGVGVLVVQHRLGFTSANAGIDQSNIENGEDHVLLLPNDPDGSASVIQQRLAQQLGIDVGVVISDSHGRPFRMGNVGTAIGVAGMPALLDLRGQTDLFERQLKITLTGYADMVAGAASLLTGEGNEGRPVVIVRGLDFPHFNGRASDLNRPKQQSLY
jgi:coenzyme F420-0:L-glutamate ligase / coenzyme F420-1:gamma-L-glutamate ligase